MRIVSKSKGKGKNNKPLMNMASKQLDNPRTRAKIMHLLMNSRFSIKQPSRNQFICMTKCNSSFETGRMKETGMNENKEQQGTITKD